jgi:hypothetical protein
MKDRKFERSDQTLRIHEVNQRPILRQPWQANCFLMGDRADKLKLFACSTLFVFRNLAKGQVV